MCTVSTGRNIVTITRELRYLVSGMVVHFQQDSSFKERCFLQAFFASLFCIKLQKLFVGCCTYIFGLQFSAFLFYNKQSVFVQQNNTVISLAGSDNWNILTPLELSIKSKIESVGVPLKNWNVNIYRGILTGFNEAFIISGEKKDELIASDPKSAELIRPILRGKDIKRYGYIENNLWIINVHNGIKNRSIPPIDINAYPAIKKHLDSYYSKLAKRADKGVTPYNLRNCAYMDDFSKPKIIFQEMVQSPAFCLDTDHHFICLDTGRIIVGDKLEYLLGLLNSKLFFFAIKHFYGGGGLGGNGVRMKHTFFQQFSAYVPNADEEQFFKKICKDTISAEISAEIDAFFYSKYSLSNEEISFIEKEFNELF